MKRALVSVFLLIFAIAPVVSVCSVAGYKYRPTAIGIELSIDFGNDTESVYPEIHGDTVLEATQNATSVELNWYGDRAFVIAISGVANDAEAGLWWQYWVNGELGSVAANQYMLSNNDTIAWRRIPPAYTTPTESSINPSTLIALMVLPIIGVLTVSMFYFRRRQND